MSDPASNIPPESDPERYFRTDHLETDLKGRSVRSGIVTLSSQILKFLLNIGGTIVLARLLTPQDYGLIAMVSTVSSLVVIFQDLGLSGATIQKPQINQAQVSTLFWINFGLGVAIALFMGAISPLLAWFYQEPRLVGITLVVSLGFILGGLTVQHQALLKRQMRFVSLAVIDIVSMIISVIVGIIAAFYGAGYWALAIGPLVGSMANMVGTWLVCPWRPGPPVRHSGIGSMLAFGGNLTGFNFLNYFSRNFDNVLIGWRFGAEQLGFYDKAYQLLLLPIRQINVPIANVALPALCRLQSDPERYKSYYYKAIRLMVTFGMPVVAFMCVSADKAILLLFGKQWVGAILLFQLLSPQAFLGTFNVATGWVYASLGHVQRQLRWQIMASVVTVLSFIIGLPWGAAGVAIAYSICSIILRFPELSYCYQGTPLRLTVFLATIARPALASIGAAVALAGMQLLLPKMNLAIGLLVDSVLYSLFYIALWLCPPNGKQAVSEILRIAKTIKKPKES
ncbi:MAG: lipopolysaccharide biosynthesis protein [Phormidium sp.]